MQNCRVIRKNEKKERLLVYVSDEGEVVPRNLEEKWKGLI